MPNITTFKGLITDSDGGDLPPGSSKEQKNVVTSVNGELVPRQGIQPATFSATNTIGSGYNTFQKMCFCKTRTGEVIGVNGIDRGFIWNGISTNSVTPLGIEAPAATPTITRSAITTISNVTDSSGKYKITTSAPHGFSTGNTVLIGNITGTGSVPGDLNGKKHVITVTSTTAFTIDGSTHTSGYAGGGACSLDGTGTTKGDYLCAYRYVDLQSTPIYSNITTGTKVEALTSDKLVWSSLSAPTETRVDRIQLWRTTAGVTNVFFLIAEFAVSGAITSSADASGKIRFTVPLGHGLVVGQNFTVADSSVGADNATHEVTAVTDTTVTTATNSTGGGHSGTGGTWSSPTDAYEDNVDDDTLNLSEGDNVLLVVANPGTDNTIIARRFVPPPDDMAYCVMFQDRYFYFGVVNYNVGTVGTGGSATNTLTGSGTAWTTAMIDRYIEIEGQSEAVKITARGSATQLTLEKNVTVANGTKYVIYPEKSRRRTIYYSYQDEPESVPASNAMILQENSGDDDAIVGAMPYGPYLYIISQRHKYALSYSQDPVKDGSIRYLDDRGAFNHDCWDYFENEAYLMDDSGCYKFSGSNSESISEPIHDLFRKDGSGDKVDFTKSANFFVKVDRLKEKVYFFVSFVGDSGNYPTRALVYNIRRESFDPMHYPIQITAASMVEKDGQTRLIFSAENEKIYLADEGNTDVVTSETKGTVSSSTSTTLVDSSKTFVAAMVGASVYIYEGTGKGQRRTILSASSHTLGVAAWTTNPDTTSKYVIGAIEWNWKTGSFPFVESEQTEDREVVLNFDPTTNNQSVDMRFYYNNDDDPTTFEIAQDLGEAVKIEYDNRQDVVVHMGKDYDSLQESNGQESFHFDGMTSFLAYADHKVAFELRGYSGTDRPKIQSINIKGVGGQ